ncbi:MAG: peptidoglycan editing factor PgeF [Syntrophaceae bacterium]|nr:peptidoglycan editing factor PgeF [Syntrophaceae bacterium]
MLKTPAAIDYQPLGFRKTTNFFEVILENWPSVVMVFSVRIDTIQGYDSVDKTFKEYFSTGEDYSLLAGNLQIEHSKIISINQIHSSKILTLGDIQKGNDTGDAIISSEVGYYPSVKTADCQAILIIDPIKKISVAVHAGWRGTVQRITRQVIWELQSKFGCNPVDMIAALGPSIGACCYEVDETVLKPFKASIPEAEQFISELRIHDPSTKTSRMSKRIDLRMANKKELTMSGLRPENIRDLNLCTHCNERIFHSYRRNRSNPGRMIALAGFRN